MHALWRDKSFVSAALFELLSLVDIVTTHRAALVFLLIAKKTASLIGQYHSQTSSPSVGSRPLYRAHRVANQVGCIPRELKHKAKFLLASPTFLV